MAPPGPVTVSPTALALDVGKSAIVTASLSPKSWTTSNPAVTAIVPSGRTCTVRGLAAGQADVVAKNGPNVATCRVTVKAVVVPPEPEPIPPEPEPEPPTSAHGLASDAVGRASSSDPANLTP